jgi:hypothetical protein
MVRSAKDRNCAGHCNHFPEFEVESREIGMIELPITDPELRRRVEERAFEIWKSEGFPSGRDWAHWVQAEAEIIQELEASKPEARESAPVKSEAKTIDGERTE